MCKIEIGRVGWHPKGYFPYRCDRNVGSALKNPFGGKHVGKISREESCMRFSEYFSEQMSQRTSSVFKAVRFLLSKAKSRDYTGIYLQCHCYPMYKPCHCETIKEYLEKTI